MEKQALENLILECDQKRLIQMRNELLDVYIKLYPQEYDECSLFEVLERCSETVH